jgi:DNA repair protein RecO (recombination protein O)
MALHKDEAIVLFKRAFGESDKIVRLYTLKAGKLSAIAKGANKSQKRFMNTLEPFNHIRVEYFEKQEKGMVRIENADIIETGCGIDLSLMRACTAGFFTEFVDRLTKEKENHKELFDLLREILHGLCAREFDFAETLFYQLRMLKVLGYLPNLNACVFCGAAVPEERKVCFSRERGGILCGHCARSIPHRVYPGGVIPGIASIGEMEHYRLSEDGVGERGPGYALPGNNGFERLAREIMEGFISFHLDVNIKSYRILKSLLK